MILRKFSPLAIISIGFACAFSFAACGGAQRHIGFDYSCFEDCKKGRDHNRDCVQECTDKQSVTGQRRNQH